MDIEQDVSVWKNLHASTELTSDRTRPSPIILAFLERNIVPNTATRPGERMALEVGVGIGRNIVHLAELGYCDRFVGVDMTDEALAKARQLATLRGLSEKCSYIRGRAGETFPFEDHSFDFIFDIMAASTFMVGNGLRERYSREIKRLLKPGGVLFIFTGRSDGEYQKKLDISRRGVEDGTFYRSMDGTLEKGYTRSEIINLCSPLKPAVLESQSRYFRAFGHQELVRPEGFWFAVFMNEE